MRKNKAPILAVSPIIFLLLAALVGADHPTDVPQQPAAGGQTAVQSESRQPVGGQPEPHHAEAQHPEVKPGLKQPQSPTETAQREHQSSNLSRSRKRTHTTSGPGAVPSSRIEEIEALCQKTDYKETCRQSLENVRSGHPKDLLQHAFNYAIINVDNVLAKSKPIRDAARDPMTAQALDICKEVLNKAIFDFNRSIAKVDSIDYTNVNAIIPDLRCWLGATKTVQTTCLEGFQNTTGDAGEQMRDLLKTAGELSANALSMIDTLSKVFASFKMHGGGPGTGTDPGTVRSMLDETETTRSLMQASPASLAPNVVVAQDGTGQFKTIMEAVHTVPPGNNKPYVIHIKAGVYHEYVTVPNNANFVVFVGDGIGRTKISGNKNFVDKTNTYWTATVAINGGNCILRDMTIENTAGAIKHQAVALRISGDMAIVYNCQLDGYQDTVYCHSYRQFYRDTTITGTIDFLFGDAQAIFQNCKLVVRPPMESQGCMVTAQGRDIANGPGAIVLQNCSIVADPGFLSMAPRPKAYLGRPWKEYSRTIIMQSSIDGFIDPAGWSPWAGTFALDTLYYAEYQNRGPGADTSRRVTWPGIQKITPEIVQSFTALPFVKSNDWLPTSGIPFEAGMVRV